MLRPYNRATILSLRLRCQVNFLSSSTTREKLGLVLKFQELFRPSPRTFYGERFPNKTRLNRRPRERRSTPWAEN